jgi:hypothetical protein
MKLPPLQGLLEQSQTVIFAACDQHYFAEFGKSFINSVRKNTSLDIHLHLFNPTPDQINYCQRSGVSVTWEHAHKTLFVTAAQRWSHPPLHEPDKSRYDRTVNAMGKGGDSAMIDRMQKTYYACARFMRLAELFGNHQVFAVDIDAVVRKPIVEPGVACDFYLHYISGKKARYLAGGLWLNPVQETKQFLNDYAELLRNWFEKDYIYWGLDQDMLDILVPKFNHGQLPISYIDWHMHPDSMIWTAKGTRKDLAVFVNEQQKYNV